MDAGEGRHQFDRADALFRAARYGEALELLSALNARYPGTKNILFPMALCLEHLGRGPEALPLCRELMDRFHDPRAEAMWIRLSPPPLPQRHTTVDALLQDDFSGDYTLPDLGPVELPPVPDMHEEPPPRWPLYTAAGAGVAVLLGLVLARILLGDGGGTTGAEREAVEAAPVLLGVVIGFGMFQVIGTIAAIFALGAAGKLPENTIGGNVLNVGGSILVVNMISTILGLALGHIESLWIAVLAFVVQNGALFLLFHYNYRLGCGGLMIFGPMFFVVMCVAFAVPFMILLSALSIITFFAL